MILSARSAPKHTPKNSLQNKELPPSLSRFTGAEGFRGKIQKFDTRIEAIKKLRASQAGPSAVWNRFVNDRDGSGLFWKVSNKPATR